MELLMPDLDLIKQVEQVGPQAARRGGTGGTSPDGMTGVTPTAGPTTHKRASLLIRCRYSHEKRRRATFGSDQRVRRRLHDFSIAERAMLDLQDLPEAGPNPGGALTRLADMAICRRLGGRSRLSIFFTGL
jgi:hypothetical protein